MCLFSFQVKIICNFLFARVLWDYIVAFFHLASFGSGPISWRYKSTYHGGYKSSIG